MNGSYTVNSLSFGFSSQGPLFFENGTVTLKIGTFYLLVGPNGSGKSTFLRILQGIIHDEEYIEGTVQFETQILFLKESQDRACIKAHSKFVPQKSDELLVSSLTGSENIELAQVGRFPNLRRLTPLKNPSSLVQNIPLDVPVSQLSGGQRQLLSISLMLENSSAPLLIFDEPTAALDRQHSLSLAHILEEQARLHNKIVIASCHDAQLIERHRPENILKMTTLYSS